MPCKCIFHSDAYKLPSYSQNIQGQIMTIEQHIEVIKQAVEARLRELVLNEEGE